jgi:hypothetical protein
MAKQFNLSISVTTNADVTGERVAEILKRLIDAGLADAQDTVESGEGDLESAELATNLNIASPVVTPQETSVKVKHWDAYHVDGTVDTHQFDIDDQRTINGQAFITVGALEGNLDDMLSVTMEVNANPLNGIDHVPCAHVHFDNDALAVSLFKIGDKILVRPETNVSIESFSQKVNGFGETLYWIE